MKTVTVSVKGWIVIPAELRKKYHLEPGTKVAVVDYGGNLSLIPVPEDPIRTARGLFKGNKSLIKALLEDRARERQQEEEEIKRWEAIEETAL